MKKTVKQYSNYISNFDEVKVIAERYKNVRNYVYSRYSGINSLLLLKPYKKEIRDIWVKSGFAKQWGLLDRYWKLALDEAIANIKSLWSNTKNQVKEAVRLNNNLTKDEKSFINYVIKSDVILYNILTRKPFNIPIKIENLIIRSKYVLNLLNRYFRRYKPIPYSKKGKTFQIDAQMYKYVREGDKLFIEFSSLKKLKRFRVGLRDKNVHKGNLRIVLREQMLEIHSTINIKQKKLWIKENEIAIDKGYKTLFAASSGNMYGSGLNKLLSKETERLNNKNAKRNRIWSQIKLLKEMGEVEKAKLILENNFGKKKYTKQKIKYDQQTKSLINNEINNLIKIENPSEIISEDLSFVSWSDKYPKHVKRKLSRWIKGYIRERLEFKCKEFNIKYTLVNAAYTSQICSKCNCFGTRKDEVFECSTCGKMHADTNASKNIKQRKNDKEINLYTSYKQVKKILEERQKKLQTI